MLVCAYLEQVALGETCPDAWRVSDQTSHLRDALVSQFCPQSCQNQRSSLLGFENALRQSSAMLCLLLWILAFLLVLT